MANKMQIFPGEDLVVWNGCEVWDLNVKRHLPNEWCETERVLIYEDGPTFLGIDPAERTDASGKKYLRAIAALPKVKKAIAARLKEYQDGERAAHKEHYEKMKAQAYNLQIVAKGKVYWAPYMLGFEQVCFDPSAGDKLFNRAVDAESAGLKPAVAPKL